MSAREIDEERRMDDPEKPVLEGVEGIIALSEDPRITSIPAKEQKSIIWKVDLRLTLTLGCLYCISLLDRTNLGAANIAG